MDGLGHAGGDEDRGTRNDLSGTVSGPTFQIGHVTGDVRIGESAQVDVVPHEVPVPSPAFVNRERELAHVRGLLTPEAKGSAVVAVLTGLPGAGKTATVQRAVALAEGAYAGGEMYVDFARLRDGGDTAVNDGLADCLRALGVHDWVMPPTLAARANLYRTRTKNRPVLVGARVTQVSARAAVR